MDDDQHNPDSHEDGSNPNPGGDTPTSETVSIQWRDLEFTVPKNRLEWDMNVQFEFEDGRRVRALFTLLGGNGPEGIRKVRSKVYESAKTAADLNDFIDHLSSVLEKECVGNLP
jgi:hypothetical protein